MTDKMDEILAEVKELKSWLYGANGFEGDIPEIKVCYKDHHTRIRRIELVLAGLAGTGALGGGVLGLIKWLTVG